MPHLRIPFFFDREHIF